MKRSRHFALGVFLICLGVSAWGQLDRGGIYRLDIQATPRQVASNGNSTCRVRVELRDQQGHLVPDGTQVIVHTDLGMLSEGSTGRQPSLNVRTTGGYIVVFATSAVSGTATITVQAADSRSSFRVDFLPEGEVAQASARVVHISGGWVGYSTDLQMLEARDKAHARFGRLDFEVRGVLQVSVDSLILKAQDVTIHRGDRELVAADVYFNLAENRGVARRFGAEQVERIAFDGLTLNPSTTPLEAPEDAFQIDKTEADSWLVCRGISYFLREKIVLRRPAIWSGDRKILSLPPIWIIGLDGYAGASNTQAVGLTSSGELAVDFPFFYRATDTATGSIRLQKGAQSSWSSGREGWSLAIEEEYRDGQGTEGLVSLNGLPQSDWGFSWSDMRPMFERGQGYFNLALPDHRSLFADANLIDYRAGGRVSLRGYYDVPRDYSAAYGLVADWLQDPRPIGKHNLTYRLGLNGGMTRASTERAVLVNEIYSELSLGTRPAGKRTTFSPQITNTFSWDTSGYGEDSLRSSLRADHAFSSSCGLGLDLSNEWRFGNSDSPRLLQVLGADFRAFHGRKWTSYVTASWDFTHDSLYSYANVDYYPKDSWRLGMLASYYDLSTSVYRDFEFSLGRMLGQRELTLIYSTDTGRFFASYGGFSTQ